MVKLMDLINHLSCKATLAVERIFQALELAEAAVELGQLVVVARSLLEVLEVLDLHG